MAENYRTYRGTFRGDLQAIVGSANALFFVTVHPEGLNSDLYRLDSDKFALRSSRLPCGGISIASDNTNVWVGGNNRKLYRFEGNALQQHPLKTELDSNPVKLALVSRERLAVVAGKNLVIVRRNDGELLQSLELPEAGSALATDKTGQWLAVGTSRGNVSVFECEEAGDFTRSETEKLHEGAVTSLLFEPEELRFFSAGADQKLLLTHARGKLEPEDKGRANNHEKLLTALVLSPKGDRIYSGSHDRTIKNWPRSGFVKPATVQQGVGKVLDLAIISVQTQPHLVAACTDNSLRIFPIETDDGDKIGDMAFKILNAYMLAEHQLTQSDVTKRESALNRLASYQDIRSLEMIAERVKADDDHTLRLLAAQLLGDSGHPRAAKLLESHLKHSDEAVRMAALAGLRKLLGSQSLRPLNLALKAQQVDVGTAAVSALAELARSDDQAMGRLTSATDVEPFEVRRSALLRLESVNEPNSPEGNLLGLKSKHADVRRLALVRLFQRGFMDESIVRAAMRRATEDDDAEVRQAALLLSLLARPELATALRARDSELHRQLFELEKFEVEPVDQGRAREPALQLPVQPPVADFEISPQDSEPLLQAMASRSLDTCLSGTRFLALLGDTRAFGVLLQLSREQNAQARREVCRSLAALNDPRGIPRLRGLLQDKAPEVRDAAFSALAEILSDQPLEAADAGLSASFEDVRRRGLQILIQQIRETPPQSTDDPQNELLVRALNDSVASVRNEAFKACLNVEVAGGGVGTLRFVLGSVHDDIRREVLTEAMAQHKEPWAWDLLLRFLDDPEPRLRKEAFDFAIDKAKDNDLGPLNAGILSVYPDTRLMSANELAKRHTDAAQTLLAAIVEDDDLKVRHRALEALIALDARDSLVQAMSSRHVDVRLQAAKARAKHGDLATLQPLVQLATQPEPEQGEASERVELWQTVVESALQGLGELGDPSALDQVLPLLDNKHQKVRSAAAVVIKWLIRAGTIEKVKPKLQHSDSVVKMQAALACCFYGDRTAQSLLFTSKAAKTDGGSDIDRLIAAFLLGEAAENHLIEILDSDNQSLRQMALILLLILDWKSHDGTPRRCLACLSSREPRVRLSAAAALERFNDSHEFLRYITRVVNEHPAGEKPWEISSVVVAQVATLVVGAEPHIRARTIQLLLHLNRSNSSVKQAQWDQPWSVHENRYRDVITRLVDKSDAKHSPESLYSDEQLRQLAFGAYIGLVREQGGSSPGASVIRVRQTALNRVLGMAQSSSNYAQSALPVLVQALGDPNQDVRMLALNHLRTLGMDLTELGAAALQAGHTDLGVEGLKMLIEGADESRAATVLEQVMLDRDDELAIKAADLLIERTSRVAVSAKCLQATNKELRNVAVDRLTNDYDDSDDAKTELRAALGSRFRAVRAKAAMALAKKKDTAALEALAELLQTENTSQQIQIIRALEEIGDPRAPDALIARIEDDASKTAVADQLLSAAANYRDTQFVDRLLKLGEKKEHRDQALIAVLTLSGHDQQIEFEQDELPENPWEYDELDYIHSDYPIPSEYGSKPSDDWQQKQHPRHDNVLAGLVDFCYSNGETEFLLSIMKAIRWSQSSELDVLLPPMANHSEDQLRHATIEVIGFRLRKRNGASDTLLKSLEHQDPQTKFLAAENLAKAGRNDGINVLLAGIELMDDIRLRQRCFKALGELADERALDIVLKMANDDGHALQEVATEAIGHFGRSNKADEIFLLLRRLARRDDGRAAFAIRGLRWFNTAAAWNLVRQCAIDRGPCWSDAIEVLAHNDVPETRDLMLRIISSNPDSTFVEESYSSAQQLFGESSLEPDYAYAKNGKAFDQYYYQPEFLERICKNGEPSRIFEVLETSHPDVQQQLSEVLLCASPPPLDEAAGVLDHDEPVTVEVAAHLVGRSIFAEAGPAVDRAVGRWHDRWHRQREVTVRFMPTLPRERDHAEANTDLQKQQKITTCLERLMWAAGRLGVASELLFTAARGVDDPMYRSIRLAAFTALCDSEVDSELLALLDSAALDEDQEIRVLAISTLSRASADRAVEKAGDVLSDRVGFNRLVGTANVDLGPTLQTAVSQPHYQSIVLPHLITEGSVETLDDIINDRQLTDATRLGAIEGLSRIASEEAESCLIALGQSEGDEDLRRAAWRGVRRSKRRRERGSRSQST